MGRELETQVLENASKFVWELILDNNGMGKEINQTVERVFCKLSDHEPPLFPPQEDADDANVKDNAREESRAEKEEGREVKIC
ncbi:hypothetical protein RchiOBHm_Chr5g0001621 [Rosa chinensis]|uniref:Uncharacterized protein n=1 Tax=Rosa chinensis TaxID=74649 RepID=A0A2P6Q2C6_ROSCH|nr:hypothetical protein RchiOBHm_Chr5g0001621 [Rosa chinensis]